MASNYDYFADASRATGIGPAPESGLQKFWRRGISSLLDDDEETAPVTPVPEATHIPSSTAPAIEQAASDLPPPMDAGGRSNLWAHHDFNTMGGSDPNPTGPPMVDDTYANRLGYSGSSGARAEPAGGSLEGLASHAFKFSDTGFDPNAQPSYEWRDTPSMGHNFRTLARTDSSMTPMDRVEGEQDRREARDYTTGNYIKDLGLQSRSRLAEIQAEDPYSDLRAKAEAAAYPERIRSMTELEKTNRELQSKESIAQLDSLVKARVAQTEASARRDAAQMMGPGREMAKSSLGQHQQDQYYQARQQADAKLMVKRQSLEGQPDAQKAAGMKAALDEHERELSNLDHAYGKTSYRESQSEEVISSNPAEK